MSRKSQSSSARSSRFGVRALGFPRSPTSPQAETDDWCIPYNGPYEVPKGYLRHDHLGNQRDAMYNGDHTVFGHKREVQYASGIEGRKKPERSGWSSEPEDRKVRNKLRAPPNCARAIQRRSSALIPPNNTRYTPNTTFSGGSGIGESPMPIQRQLLLNHSVPPSNRLSLGNLWSFGGKKTTMVQWSPPIREFTGSAVDLYSPRFNQPTKRTSQDVTRPLLKAVSIDHLRATHSALTDDEDCYTPLASHPKRECDAHPPYSSHFGQRSAPKLQRQPSMTSPILADESDQSPSTTVTITFPSPRPHPYAYIFPSAAFSVDGPQSAPPALRATSPPRKQKGIGSDSEDSHARPTAIPVHLKPHPFSSSRGALLKGSISTPNLRGSVKDQTQHSIPRGKDRWLSAETWCDALLFPRPRFKITHGSASAGSDDEKRSSRTTSGKGSGRIVSPPDTPILGTDFDTSADLYSWTIKKDALPTLVNPHRPIRPRGLTLPTMTRSPTSPPITRDLGVEVQAVHVPKQSAKDDLEPSSPTPSLNRVLEEGNDLERQRDAWRQQAQQSFQNKRSRSLSRSRSKSLTRSGRHQKDAEAAKPMSNIDFLATLSLLGAQSMSPTITSPRPVDPAQQTHMHATSVVGIGTSSGQSQSHGTHSHTNSKSSKGHSRNPSWQKSALRVAKSAGALCGLPDEDGAATQGTTTTNLERTLGTNRVQITETTGESYMERENLTTTIIGHGVLESGTLAVSPIPSEETTGEVEGVGIAVTSEDPNMDDLRMPDHPYGAGIYGPTHTNQAESVHRRLRSADYAGPHPTMSKIAPVITVNDVSTRHRHPYAQQSSSPPMNEAGIKPQMRNDSAVSPSSKMWVQLFPDEVQEVLPEELVYTPDLRTSANETPADDGHSAGDSTLPTDDDNRLSSHAYVLPDPNRTTRLGVVEALTSAFRRRGSIESGDEESTSPRLRVDDMGDRLESTGANGSIAYTPSNDSGNSSEFISHAQPLRRNPVFLQDKSSHPATAQSSTPIEENNLVSSASAVVDKTPLSNPNLSSISSSGINSPESSPPVSPRPLGYFDNLDHFRDLFYRPDQSYVETLPTHERPVESFISDGISWSSRGNRTASGLTSLARQIGQELEDLAAQDHFTLQFESESVNSVQGVVGLGGQSHSKASTDPVHFVLSEGPISQSPMADSSSLRLDDDDESNQPPSVNIPEDVESSRASSVIEHCNDDGEAFDLVRVGLVEAVSTPPAIEADRRASGHISLIDENALPQDELSGQLRTVSHTDSLQPWSATRSSYMTSDTGASRISGLSDFPDPPISNMTPAHMSFLASYFSNVPAEMDRPLASPDSPIEATAHSEPPHADFPVRRMTFGGSQDIEKLDDAERSKP